MGFPDDDPDSPYAKDDPDLLRNRPVGQRALVISAGIIANVVLAYSVLLAQVTQGPGAHVSREDSGLLSDPKTDRGDGGSLRHAHHVGGGRSSKLHPATLCVR